MKFRLGKIPPNPDFHPEQEGWRPLREPGPIVMQLVGLPIGVAVVVVLGAAAALLGMANLWKVHPAMILVMSPS